MSEVFRMILACITLYFEHSSSRLGPWSLCLPLKWRRRQSNRFMTKYWHRPLAKTLAVGASLVLRPCLTDS